MRISLNFVIFILLFSNIAFAEATEAGICTGCEKTAVASPIKKISDKIDEKFNQMTFLDPVTVEKMDSRQLAEMIVSRLHNKCDGLKNPSKNWVNVEEDDTDIIMMVPAAIVSSVQEFGFKNQHQTSSTKGIQNAPLRYTAENTHVELGLGYSNKTRDLLPKYSLQVFVGKLAAPHDMPSGYGEVAFKFKKQVKKRATWYQKDSLEVKGQLHTNRLHPAENMHCLFYCEAQVWGDLDLSDVESILVKEGSKIPDSVKKLGLPVHTYKRSLDENTKLSIKATISEKPVFVPGSKTKKPASKLTDKSVKELQKLLLSEKSDARKQILKGHLLSKMSNSQLMESYQKMEKTAPVSYEAWRDSHDITVADVRTIGELAARSDDVQVREFLLNEFNTTKNNAVKSMALSGLSSLPSSELKPLLLLALQSEDRVLKTTAFYTALQFRNDPEIEVLLQKNADIYNAVVKKETCKMGDNNEDDPDAK